MRIQRGLAALTVVAGLTLAAPAAAQAVYSIQSGTYSAVNNSGPCVIGPCSSYAMSDTVSGTFTVTAPFAPNLTNFDIGPDIQAFSFDDGAVAYESSNPRARIANALISTDATGAITDYRLVFQVLHGTGSTYPVATDSDVEARFSYFLYEGGFAAAGRNNYVCLIRRGDSAASGPGTCGSDNSVVDSYPDGSSRWTSGATPTTPVLVSYTPPPVPTLTEWAMIGLTGLMALGGAVFVQRRRHTV